MYDTDDLNVNVTINNQLTLNEAMSLSKRSKQGIIWEPSGMKCAYF